MVKPAGLFAYPSSPTAVGEVIKAVLREVDSSLVSWEENDIAGRFLLSPVLTRIEDGNCLFADITYLNFNVVFEIGYAIGRNKRVFLVKNASLKGTENLIKEIGIFDTLGYEKYTNSIELSKIIAAITETDPLPIDRTKLNRLVPVYLVLPKEKTDSEIRVISRLRKARLESRIFDPEDHGRLAAGDAIDNVSQSLGVATVLLSSLRIDAEVHNIRAAFVAGLAMALDKPLLLLQLGNEPIPLDCRDLVKTVSFQNQIDEHVADFSPNVIALFQLIAPAPKVQPKTFVASINLGSSSAEHEVQDLAGYYLETDEFRRASRGEVRIVAGRKGTGKSALFFQLRNRLREFGKLVVVDLRPEAFQLLKFKERVLDFLEEGSKNHTITVFWEYLLLLETCHKILKADETIHMRDQRLYEPYRKLVDAYGKDPFVSEGDFAERMLMLTKRVGDVFEAKNSGHAPSKQLTSGEISEIIYIHDVTALRNRLIEYLKHKDGLWILFDNLDKGWPPFGVTAHDVITLRCLIEALTKIEQQFIKRNVLCHGVVFIRNDVYELLVDSSPDRGKVAQITLDWTDQELLRELLRRRFIYALSNDKWEFHELWLQTCVSHINGEETSQYIIERSLMRPRGLIDLLRLCRGHAVNLGHEKIEVEDIEAGETNYSNALLNEMSLEIRDVCPQAEGILYEFLECPSELAESQILEFLKRKVESTHLQKVIDILLWYGFLGLVRNKGEFTFIYHAMYDIRKLKGLIDNKRLSGGARFVINAAFWKALETKPVH